MYNSKKCFLKRHNAYLFSVGKVEPTMIAIRIKIFHQYSFIILGFQLSDELSYILGGIVSDITSCKLNAGTCADRSRESQECFMDDQINKFMAKVDG